MKTKEEILVESTNHTLNIINGSPLHNAMMIAMQEYAEEYHRTELLKLNKSDVISSVCICECGKEAPCPICIDCFKKGLEREQTDL